MKWLQEKAFSQGGTPFLYAKQQVTDLATEEARYEEVAYTYQEIYDLTVFTAEEMAPYVEDVSRVALLAENSTLMAIHLFALSALKKEVVLLNTMLTDKEKAEQLELTEVDRVIVSDTLAKDWVHRPRGVEVITFTEIRESEADREVELDFNPAEDDVFVIINTSATTGKVKSVPVRWGQIASHVEASAKRLGVQKEDNWLVVLPMFHVSGLSIIMRTLYNGTAATIRTKFKAEETIEDLNSGQVNMVSLVPTVLSRIADKVHSPSLRCILLGGEFIPMTLLKDCIKLNLPVYKTYGMSESFAQSTTMSIREYPNKLSSVGQPLEGVEIDIRHPDKDGAGEVWLKSPMLMKGYLNQEPIGTWFNTDDIGYVDEDGFLYLLNRRKDIIISGGENIYPKEIEDVLYGLDGVKECAIVPVADPKWGQVPVACIVGDVSEEEVRDYLLTHVAKYKVPRRIEYFEELPKNATGKVLRNRLVEEL